MKGTAVIDTEQELVLNGTITLSGTLSGSITKDGVLCGSILKSGTLAGRMTVDTEHETYSGIYDVAPKIEPQILNTSDKVMTQDMKIKAIPYYSVSNEHGGNTIIIGGNI